MAMLNLEKYFKKYIWDDERTPYFVPVRSMTRRQADYELHAYAIFVGILFAMVSGGALLSQDPHIKSDGVAVYGFTVICAAVILESTKAVQAAWYCAAVRSSPCSISSSTAFTPISIPSTTPR
jgi:hypothetical protein